MFHMFSTYDDGSIAQMPIRALFTEQAITRAQEWLVKYDHGFSHAIVVNDAQALAWMWCSASVIHSKVEGFIERGFVQDLIVAKIAPEEMSLEVPTHIPANWVEDIREGMDDVYFPSCELGTCITCCEI